MKSRDLLSEGQVALLKESFSALAVDPETATMALFERLFELDPRLRFLFPEDLHDQKQRMMSMIGFIVRRLERWDQVEPREGVYDWARWDNIFALLARISHSLAGLFRSEPRASAFQRSKRV